MRVYFITFRSITPAQRGELLLRNQGFRCVLQRTPRWMQDNGCGYCLRLGTDRIDEAVELLEQAGIFYRRLYRQDRAGNTVEVER